ncbi:hematopoietic prostaglandin D synthase-like [Clavelina lepadiformis]|uniref:hematopoietic prostaglandin D synthase-like n=1 Tax=Clavelina lepadiformis TaxID=159417 RepID=UPI0040433283
MSQYRLKLIYFPHMGREEIARVMLAYAGMEYEDVRIPYAKWPEMKPTMPFSQLPVLEVNGHTICQSGAIVRYIAKLCGFNGSDFIQEAKADMICECCFDIMMRFPWTEENEQKKKEVTEKLLLGSIPDSLKQLEVMLTNGGEYFVGKLTYADVALMNAGQYLLEQKEDILDATPKLKEHLRKIENIPGIAKWLSVRPGGK